jgi:hypothetical protein
MVSLLRLTLRFKGVEIKANIVFGDQEYPKHVAVAESGLGR